LRPDFSDPPAARRHNSRVLYEIHLPPPLAGVDTPSPVTVQHHGWYPVVTGAAVRFRRSLKLWQRYTITTRILGWDERSFYIQQVFESRGELVNEIWLEGRFLARSGPKPSIAEVLALAGHTGPSPALEPAVSDWLGALHAERTCPARPRRLECQPSWTLCPPILYSPIRGNSMGMFTRE